MSIGKRLLDFVERAGNKLPDPLTLFFIFSVIVVLVSFVLSLLGVSVVHPGTGQVIEVQNLLTAANIRKMFTEMVNNFTGFRPLGLVLVTMIGIGVAERGGLITAALKRLVTVVPPVLLPATLVFAGIMSNMAADAGYVVLTPLGAVLFAAFGRHPIAGLAAAFAGVSGGFSANLLLTSLDPLLSGISTEAAKIVDPSYVVQPTANYYFMIVSTIVITIVGTWVTTRVVEPRLGAWVRPQDMTHESSLGTLSEKEISALKIAGWVFVLCMIFVAIMAVPEKGVLRDDKGGLEPFYHALVPIIMLVFLICGVTYGVVAGTIKSDKDVANMASDSMASMGAYIILAFIAAQFVAYFAWSNIGMALAVSGANTLKSIGLAGAPLLIGFIIVSALINIFIGSASAKWAVMGPVFIPMLMLMGYSPELTQNAYRIGDSITNIITPLLPYFPIIIAFARKYQPQTGIGTMISVMLPYSVAFGVVWVLLFVIWYALGVPLGPDVPLVYSPGPG